MTTWEAGDSIITNDDVSFSHTGSGETKWVAANNIFSTACSNTILFTHTGTGDTYWEATNEDINIKPAVSFSKTNIDNGYTEWIAEQNINTHNDVTFTSAGNTTSSGGGTKWYAGDSIIVDQECSQPKTVAFTNNSTTDDYIWWHAGKSILVDGSSSPANPIQVNFLNQAQNDDDVTNYMKWQANTEDIRIRHAKISFTTDVDSKGYTEWYAGDNILMDFSKIDFQNGTVSSTATNENTYWHAVGGDIHANNTPITFMNNGTGYTWWQAGNDILLHDQSPTTFTDAGTANWLKLQAYRDIRTGINSPMVITHNSPNPASPYRGDITVEATTRNVWTQSSVDIVNNGINNNTLIYAGQDIRIDSTLTFTTGTDGIESVKLRADNGDIIVNTGSSDIHPSHLDLTSFVSPADWCDTHRAAVNFTLAGAGVTEWWAKQNIIATDTIHFHYDNSGGKAGNILLHAEVNNIDLRRPFKVDIDTASTIRLEALAENLPARRKNKHEGHGGVYDGTSDANLYNPDLHNQTYGSIRTSDSVVINRLHDGAEAGHTEIEAYNDIQTAMFDFTSANQKGDTTDIVSRMGDIWLGYSWTNPALCSTNNIPSPVGFDLNRFIYRVPTTAGGKLNIKSGYDDTNTDPYGGGNVYFTHIVDSLGKGGTYNTEISIPYSNMFSCTNGLYGANYERAGIIGGVARCQSLVTPPSSVLCTDTGLIHVGNDGNLLVNAGTRGNIIFNNGAYLQFQEGLGNAKFLTQWGDIDMRHPFDVDSMSGSVLFYANSFLSNKLNVLCGCDEQRNNVYLQDFRYIGHGNSGSVFIGADNNIKLQYGGLRASAPTARDPFYNISGYANNQCSTNNYHCDADTTVNQARHLLLNFDRDTTGAPVSSGGFAAVASDLIDVYRNIVYYGGNGSGMGSVPDYNTLHGEGVAGYGLYIKTQANKRNWNIADYMIDHQANPLVGAACSDDGCSSTLSFLHNTARVTFHSDARIYTQGQRSLIASPVLETYGFLDLNTSLDPSSRTAIRIQTDSLIMHDSLIIDGSRTTFASWSPLRRNMPVFKFGHQRTTPPFSQSGCSDCYTHELDESSSGRSPLDTIFVTYRNGASVPRLHTLVADQTVLSFLTDSFDHTYGNPTINAKFYVDTFKIRNHVELLEKEHNTHDGHFELISEIQMTSKDYAGIYARHLHLEPVAPECSDFGYSQFWPFFNTLDVIPTTRFGGYGWIHSDVHLSIGGYLAPGYASLGRDGNCYEQKSGYLRMKDLRIDREANLKVSLGESAGFYKEEYYCDDEGVTYMLGEFADFIDVDSLSVYSETPIEVVIRPEGLNLEPGESRCFPILRYNKIAAASVLNHFTLKQNRLTSKDHPSINESYPIYLIADTVCHILSICVGKEPVPQLVRTVTIPAVPGVKTDPPAGVHYVDAHGNFSFKAIYSTRLPLAVKTTRATMEEEVIGTLNENGEYEYFIPQIYKHIVISFGPEYADADTPDGTRIWSHNETLYIKVEREDVASVYSITGQLIKRIDVAEGNTAVPMIRGVYIVTLKDGSIHKVIIR
ncbi:MAG: hypothetical protein LBS42_00220 [Tannerella sp.]|nr:hypothetical protein [Tannerella sp.]